MQPQVISTGSSGKGMTVLDEFVHGFPSEGLSVVSYKWWKSDNPQGGKSDITVIDVDEVSSTGEVAGPGRSSDEDKRNTSSSPSPQGPQLLKSIRKRAVTEGREARKLGVFRGWPGREISKKEKVLLLGIFQSSLPEGWLKS
ncbi:hypothetical protein MLD38_030596 [Melastoma candidum]|uniref:Uncharacterized protein n=1 Tax=Melastoma candidum TaxID=119954 RepID=A0ACB9MM32_9MYRT|nr:hypothetical protein MLD38_030596 [Melastoma candidum]